MSSALLIRPTQSGKFGAQFLALRHQIGAKNAVVGVCAASNLQNAKRGGNDAPNGGISFENAQEAFKCKTNWDLVRAFAVFRCCQMDFLVANNAKILAAVEKVFGKTALKRLLQSSFYGHFAAGETLDQVSRTVDKLSCFGVKSILNYSVEADIHEEQGKPLSQEMLAHIGQECDRNAAMFEECAEFTSRATHGEGITVFKLTSLCRPHLLIQLTDAIVQTERTFKAIALSRDGQDGVPLALETFNEQQLFTHLQKLGLQTDVSAVGEWFRQMDANKDGLVDQLDMRNLVDLDAQKSAKLVNLKTGQLEPVLGNLTSQECAECAHMMERLKKIAEHALARGVRIMIDAEQTYFQPAINLFTMALQRRYNRERAQVLNTYQGYLRNSLERLSVDLQLARREDFHFGCKLVRGAYMDQERALAAAKGYEDPINPSHEATSAMYHRCLDAIMDKWAQRGRTGVFVIVASHNVDTIRHVVDMMKKRGISPREGVVNFGQLLGMCDYVSFTLGQAGYSVFKNVPYGPVENVLPYLTRRALENGAMLKNVEREKRMLGAELWRRFSHGQLVHPVAQVAAPKWQI